MARRGAFAAAEIVKDVDIVASVAHDADRAALMHAFVEHPHVENITGSGDTKLSVTLRSGIAVDLRVVLDDEYPYTLHHFTGSEGAQHRTAYPHARARRQDQRIWAISRRETHPRADEADIYAAIGMDYIEPELREDRGEIEAALEHRLPKLITERDIRGMLHVHSNWSDGGSTIREMAEATLATGMSYLGMRHDSQAAAYANGLTPDRVKRQQEEIDSKLNEEYAGRLRILKGTECDILKDGALDYDNETLASFDFVVASIHGNFNLCLRNRHNGSSARWSIQIADPGHPTGRLLLQREGYNPDLDRSSRGRVS